MPSNKNIQYQIYKLLLLILTLMISALNISNILSNSNFNLSTASPLNIVIISDSAIIITLVLIFIFSLFINFWGVLNNNKISIIINIIIFIHCIFWLYWSISYLIINNSLIYTNYVYKYIPTAILSTALVISFLMQGLIISYRFKKKTKKTIANKSVSNNDVNNIEYSSVIRRTIKFLDYKTSEFYKLYFLSSQTKWIKFKNVIKTLIISLMSIAGLVAYSILSIYLNKSPTTNTENSLYTEYVIILSLTLLISWFFIWINYYNIFIMFFTNNKRGAFFLEFLNILLIKINIDDYVNYSNNAITINGQKIIYKINIKSVKRNKINFTLLSANDNLKEILEKEKLIDIKNDGTLAMKISHRNNILKLIIRIFKEDVNND